MKLRILILLLGAAFSSFCQNRPYYDPNTGWYSPYGRAPTTPNPLNNIQNIAPSYQEEYNYRAYLARQAKITAERQAILQRIYAQDAWRIINGKTNFAGGKGWAEFSGKLIKNQDNSSIFQGQFGPIFSVGPNDCNTGKQIFSIRNCPFTNVVFISEKMAYYVTNTAYTNEDNNNIFILQIPVFDYGVPAKRSGQQKNWPP